MATRREITGLLLASGIAAGAPTIVSAQAGAPRVASGTRRAEALALRRFAEATHPRRLEALASAGWRQSWGAIDRQVDQMDDGTYIVSLRRALGWFKDGHTTVLPFEFTGGVPGPMKSGAFGMTWPVGVRVFDDGVWIVRATPEANSLLGARVTAIAGFPVAEVVAEMIKSWPGENPAWGFNWAGLLFSSAGLLHGLGYLNGAADLPVALDAELGGKPISSVVRPRSDAAFVLTDLARTPSPVDSYAKVAGRVNFVRGIPERKTVYVSIEEMDDVNGYTFEQLTADILDAISDPDVTRVLIDLRRNGGGDNLRGEALRRELGRSRFNRPGGIYVMISPQTFSAGQNFANRLERETFALFVGEPTGSAPNLYGDPSFFSGEASGLTAMVSTVPWFDGGPLDKRHWIFPDLFTPVHFDDWSAGHDQAFQAALDHIASGANDFTTRTRYFERSSQRVKWQPFWISQ